MHTEPSVHLEPSRAVKFLSHVNQVQSYTLVNPWGPGAAQPLSYYVASLQMSDVHAWLLGGRVAVSKLHKAHQMFSSSRKCI